MSFNPIVSNPIPSGGTLPGDSLRPEKSLEAKKDGDQAADSFDPII